MNKTTTPNYEVSDFQRDVIDASHQLPVLVDFWAPWCGPCRMLSPTLERLADDEAEWTLVKINTDEHPDLAQQYRIRGIPAVKLFADGEVIDEFTGVMPEHAIRQWLEKVLPSENKHRVEQAEAALDADDPETAEPLLRQVLREEPTNPKAQILLAKMLAFRDPDEAETLVNTANFAGPNYIQVAEAVKTVVRLLRLREQPESLPDEPGREAYQTALDAMARRDFDTALQHFVEVIQQNRYYDDDGARKACLALFTLLGEGHPTVRKHRRTFDMSLY